MITTTCICGHALNAPEASVNQPQRCPKCGAALRYVCAEALSDGAGAADFDARITIFSGPQRAGEQLFPGGVPTIQIGKLDENHIQLTGAKVSRIHCKLSRRDFGPSRWAIIDNNSTNGLFVNGQRVMEAELKDGDTVTVGDFEL